MLQSMRASAQGWIGRFIMATLMGVIILSFVIWGIGDIFRGYGANDLAQVGRAAIGADTFRNAYQTELQRLQRVERRNITYDEAHRFGLDRQVLSRLIGEAALNDEAGQLGLAVSDEALKTATVSDENFKGMTGVFDRKLFEAFLRDEGFTEKSYLQHQRAAFLRREIVEALTDGVQLPKALLEAIFRFQREEREVDYIVLPPSSAGQPPAPSEQDLLTQYEETPQLYTVPEFRSLVVLAVTPDSIAKPENVTDAEAQKRYEEVKEERFGAPEKREIEQILYANETEAKEARAKLDAGQTFETLLKDKNLTPKDASLGTVARSGLVDQAVAEAAFNLKEGEVSAPVKAQFGTVILRVGKIIPATVKPFSDVASEVKREIALQRAQGEITRLHDAIEDERTSGKSLTEAAQSSGLTPKVIDAIDATGKNPQGEAVQGLTDAAALLKAAFASDVGVDNDTLRVAGGGYQWFEVAKVEKAREKTFEEARAAVEKAWREEQVRKRLAAKTAEIVKKLDAGESMAAIAAAEGNLEVKHAADVHRSGSSGLPPNFVAQIFNTGVERAGSAEAEEGGRIVFKVTKSFTPPFDPDAPELTGIVADVKTGYAEDMVAQYLAKLQSDIGVKVNNKAFAAAAGISPDGF